MEIRLEGGSGTTTATGGAAGGATTTGAGGGLVAQPAISATKLAQTMVAYGLRGAVVWDVLCCFIACLFVVQPVHTVPEF